MKGVADATTTLASFKLRHYPVLVNVLTADMSGTIRLQRNGSTVSGYYSHGMIGSAPTTTNPTGFTIDFATPSTTAPANVAIAFDNFRVNASTVMCPQ